MSRRTLLKWVGLLPLIGPAIVKALAHSGAAPQPAFRLYLPPEFPKWDYATDGLESGWKWAADCERSHLSAELLLPRAGQVWEAIQDCEVPFQAAIDFPPKSLSSGLPTPVADLSEAAAFMQLSFGMARLVRGERVRVATVDAPKPLHVNFVPVRYEQLQDQLIPEPTRKYPGYSGYELHLKTARTIADFVNRTDQPIFTELFRLVEDAR